VGLAAGARHQAQTTTRREAKMSPEDEASSAAALAVLTKATLQLQEKVQEIIVAINQLNNAIKIIHERQQGLTGRVSDVESNIYK
jgi:hypothetical protein